MTPSMEKSIMFMHWWLTSSKYLHYPKQFTRFKTPMTFFSDLENMMLKFTWIYKTPRIAKAIVNIWTKAGAITKPKFKTNDMVAILKQPEDQ